MEKFIEHEQVIQEVLWGIHGRKVYMIRSIGGVKSKCFTFKEEYDLEMRTWTEIQNMSLNGDKNDTHAIYGTSHLVLLVNNKFYVADYYNMEVRKYDKQSKVRVTT